MLLSMMHSSFAAKFAAFNDDDGASLRASGVHKVQPNTLAKTDTVNITLFIVLRPLFLTFQLLLY